MNHQIIILASMGRCGSTMLFNALFDSNNFIIDLHNVFNAKKNTFFKTHDFAPASLPENAKCIFLFGNVTDVVISAHTEAIVNVKQHYVHLHANYEKRNNYIYEDVLRLEENFDSWNRKRPYPVLSIRYETMW